MRITPETMALARKINASNEALALLQRDKARQPQAENDADGRPVSPFANMDPGLTAAKAQGAGLLQTPGRMAPAAGIENMPGGSTGSIL